MTTPPKPKSTPSDPYPAFTVGDYSCKGGRDTLLGKGSFADVFKGENMKTGETVAIKVVDVARLTRGNDKLKQHLMYEIQIMKELNHPNIVKFYDVFTINDSQIYMIFEFMAGGDFSKYLAKNKGLSEERAKYFMEQLASALKFLRSKNVIHRDLKPQNLLLSSMDSRAIIKIADFGFARFIEPQSVADTLCGSPLYMAPEILKMQKYTVKADLWSVGAILYEMLTGFPPFPVKSHLELLQMIDKKVQFPPHIKVSEECQNLVTSMLQQDPLKRISWEEFFLHPWLNMHPIIASNTPPETSPAASPPYGLVISGPFSAPPDNQFFKKGSPTDIPMMRQKAHTFTPGTSTSSSPDAMKKPSPSGLAIDALFSPRTRATSSPPDHALTSPRRRSMSINEGVKITKPNPFKQDSFGKIGSPSNPSGFPTTLAQRSSSDFDNYISSEDEAARRREAEVDSKGRRALTIAALGDLKAQSDSPAEALALYVKSLTLLSSVLQAARRLLQSQPIVNSNTGFLGKYKEYYTLYLKKAELLKSNLRIGDTSVVAEKIIYDFALQLGREGAVLELLKSYDKSEQYYENGLLLLDQLKIDAPSDRDKEILQAYINGFSKRLSQSRMQRSLK